jgi:VWA domain containing CoxE-like protein
MAVDADQARLTGDEERLRRWRLILGEPAGEALGVTLNETQIRMDNALGALYDSERSAGLGASSPNVNRWLGDIRSYFPTSVVQVMQRDAMERLNLKQMLLEPELLQSVQPDVHLVATLLSLSRVIPARTRETARLVVRKVVDEVERRLREATIQAIRGSLNRAERSRRPRLREIDWHRTIRANLANYVPEKKTVIAERVIGFGHRRNSLRDVVLCVDQSGSMAASVVYSGIFGSVMASIRALRTRMVVFDTSVVDLTDELKDPIDLLFGTQLGGGTDINRALAYCEQIIERPSDTILVLITDLFEGGNRDEMLHHAKLLVGAGVKMICLLALNDEGAPVYDHGNAAALANLGVPSFACSPDAFPALMAAAIQRRDLALWASQNGLVTASPTG